MSKTYTIVMLDSSKLQVVLPKRANGEDCLEQVIQSIGTLEREYFGLQHRGKSGEPLWVNARNPIREQLLKGNKTLHFRVKFFIKPSRIIQQSTRDQFYLQLKADLLAGKLNPTNSQAVTLSALVAQIERGDYYPGISYDSLVGTELPEFVSKVSDEHNRLMGVSKIVAVERFLNEAYGLERYGIEMHKVFSGQDRKEQVIGVGCDSIYLYTADMDCKERYNYSAIQFTAFHGRRFCMLLTEANYHGPREHRYELVSRCAAQALYRSITEFHTFFRRDTVGSIVKDAGYSTSLFATFKKNPVDRFYFDVLKTQREVVNHVWPLLHPPVPAVTLRRRNTTGSTPRSRPYRHPPPRYTETCPTSNEECATTTGSTGTINGQLSSQTTGNNSAMTTLQIPLPGGISQSYSCSFVSQQRETASPPPDYSESDSTLFFAQHPQSSGRTSSDAVALVSRVRELEMELHRLKESMLCRVCKANPVSVTFCPCGHTICCDQCTDGVTNCMQCSASVTHTQVFTLL